MERSSRRRSRAVDFMFPLCALVASVAAIALAWSRSGNSETAAWRAHWRLARAIPDASFTRDRFRDFKGLVRDKEARPLGACRIAILDSAAVMDAAMDAPLEMARHGSVPIECETRTASDGRFAIADPSVGLKSVVFLAEGWAPARIDAVVVRDGVANWYLDADLESPRALEVLVSDDGGAPRSGVPLFLTAEGWWPCSWQATTDATGQARFAGLGGAVRAGIVWAVDGTAPRALARWRLADAEVTRVEAPWTGGAGLTLAPAAHPTERLADPAACIVAQRDRTAIAEPPTSSRAPGALAAIRGYLEAAYLPVRAERIDSPDVRETFATASGEYVLADLPPGIWRLRPWAAWQRPVFSRLVQARAGAEVESHFGTFDRIQTENPAHRVLHGVVRLPGGETVHRAEVFCQDASSFRRYLQKTHTDESGYFRFTGVQPATAYVVFPLPPRHGDGYRDFTTVVTNATARENLVLLTLWPGEIKGTAEPRTRLCLERQRDDASWETKWWILAADDGAFRATAMPPGIWRVRAEPGDGVVWGPGEPAAVDFGERAP